MTLWKYVYEDSILSKVEFENLHGVKIVIIMIVRVAGSVVGVLYQLYVYVQGQESDRDIVDVCNLERDRGTVMLMADGVKVYVICYSDSRTPSWTNT